MEKCQQRLGYVSSVQRICLITLFLQPLGMGSIRLTLATEIGLRGVYPLMLIGTG